MLIVIPLAADSESEEKVLGCVVEIEPAVDTVKLRPVLNEPRLNVPEFELFT